MKKTNTVSLDEKIDDVMQLWSPQEDGLYVGSPPKCCRRRWRLLERRLVMAQQQPANAKTKWFRTDATLAVLPDPLRPYLIRNIIPHPSIPFHPIYLAVINQRHLLIKHDTFHLFLTDS